MVFRYLAEQITFISLRACSGEIVLRKGIIGLRMKMKINSDLSPNVYIEGNFKNSKIIPHIGNDPAKLSILKSH